MSEVVPWGAAIIVAVFKVLMESQKHSVEKNFDSQSEKSVRRVVYEALGILGVIFCAFFIIPITKLEHINVYYMIYVSCSATFLITQIVETVIAIIEFRNKEISKTLQNYKKYIFPIAIAQILIYSLALITACVHFYTVFYSILQEYSIAQNSLSAISIKLAGPNMNKETITLGYSSIGWGLLYVNILYYFWRMLISSPWIIISKHFQRNYLLTFIFPSNEAAQDLLFINSSRDYYLCFDKEKNEHRIVFKSSIEQVIIKQLPKTVSKVPAITKQQLRSQVESL